MIRRFLIPVSTLTLALCACGPSAEDAGRGTKPAAGNPAAAPAASAPADAPGVGATGTVQGRVVLKGPAPAVAPIEVTTDVAFCGGKVAPEGLLVGAGGGLENCVVTIAGVQGGKKTPGTVRFANKGCSFVPHVASATVGSELEISNADPVNHSSHIYQNKRSLWNLAFPAGDAPKKRPLRHKGVVNLKCEVHKWMSGWIVVHENDHHAVTGDDGAFSIAGVPPGTYTIKVWHEGLGTSEASITIEAEKTITHDFELALGSASK